MVPRLVSGTGPYTRVEQYRSGTKLDITAQIRTYLCRVRYAKIVRIHIKLTNISIAGALHNGAIVKFKLIYGHV